jgi:hypothetical protein
MFLQNAIAIFLFSVGTLFSHSIAIDQKRDSLIPIRRLQVFSERCSGSNYVAAFLVQHFDFDNCLDVPERKLPSYLQDSEERFEFYSFQNEQHRLVYKLLLSPYGHKHFPPWFNLPSERFFGPHHYYDFENSDDCLFVVVFRNAYDWIRSFYRTPWDAAPDVQSRSFAEFIRLPWEIEAISSTMLAQLRYNPWIDRNPQDGSLFETVLDLRKSKIENMLLIKEKVGNIYYVNYESVLENPREFIREIQNLFGLKQRRPFSPIDSYKGDTCKGAYSPKSYPPLSESDLEYINQKLDFALENRMGYERKNQ